MAHKILELNDVSQVFGSVRALDKISLTVTEGEWVSIVGSSGSGKTTLLNIIGCMNQPSHGHVLLDNQEITQLSQQDLTKIRRENIGLVFQQFHLISYLTALENVMLAQYYHSLPDEKEALEALAAVGLESRAHHYPNQLSGGEQQRVCIARAIINSPKLLLADEPTGNLDLENEQLVLNILEKLHREGSTIIVVTHDSEVAERGEREIRLNHGHLISDTRLR